ncbi:MAG: hypothetical protein ACD_73C00025G0002 [uncultured bacterium]|nr:MAG: hypothetical protein ACD_73C00025G0002 [uncultured bacterium]
MPRQFKKIYIEISNVCNLQCDFCPVVERDKKIMTEELFAKVISESAPLTDEVCFHLMGEPLTHPKIGRYLDICAQHQLPVNITSNGILLDEEKNLLLLNPIVRQINFSLHSFKANFKDKDIRPYLNKIFNFTQTALQTRPDLYLNYRLWNLENENPENDFNEEIFQHIETFFNVSLNRRAHPDWKKSKNILGRLYLHFDTRFDWPSLNAPLQGQKGFCHGLSSHIGIHADGTLVPCCLDKEAGIKLGNCQNSTIEEIIQTPRAQNIKNGFQKRQLNEDLCKRCTFIQRFDSKQSGSPTLLPD